jgi:hypothetical protein
MNHFMQVADVRQMWLDGARPPEDNLPWCVRHSVGIGRWYWSLCAELRHYVCEGLFWCLLVLKPCIWNWIYSVISIHMGILGIGRGGASSRDDVCELCIAHYFLSFFVQWHLARWQRDRKQCRGLRARTRDLLMEVHVPYQQATLAGL